LLVDTRDDACASAAAWLAARGAVRAAATIDGCDAAHAQAALAARGYACAAGAAAAGAAEAVLWRASGMLPALTAAAAGAWRRAPAVKAVLDAGCGAGRNAVALATALLAAGARVRIVALDNREAMIAKTAGLAAHHGLLGTAVVPVRADVGALLAAEAGGGGGCAALRAAGAPSAFAAYDAALFMRFVHKPALAALGAALHAAAGGGADDTDDFILAVEGFHVDAGHPQAPALKLKCGEVLELVSAAERAAAAPVSRWATIEETVQNIEDGRPVVCALLAYKRR
jgi:SAM-dependent methyltransferase